MTKRISTEMIVEELRAFHHFDAAERMEELVAQLEGARERHVGDVDDTPSGEENQCGVIKGGRMPYGCTMLKGHQASHAAGTGSDIVAVWAREEGE